MDKIKEKAMNAGYPFVNTIFQNRTIGAWDDVSFWIIKSESLDKSAKKNLDEALWLTGC